MKKGIVLLLLLVLTVGLVQAQSMRTGKKAVLFTFYGLDDLDVGRYKLGSDGNNSVYGIGFKKILSGGDMAVRPGLKFNRYSETEDKDDDTKVGGKYSSMDIGVVVDLIKYLNQENIQPYIGGGVGYMKSSTKDEWSHTKDADYTTEKSSQSGFSIRGILGIEIFIKKNISLSGEYLLSYIKGSTSGENQFGDQDAVKEDTENISILGITAAGVLTLSIYLP